MYKKLVRPEGLDGSPSLDIVCGECKAGWPGDVAAPWRDAGDGPTNIQGSMVNNWHIHWFMYNLILSFREYIDNIRTLSEIIKKN